MKDRKFLFPCNCTCSMLEFIVDEDGWIYISHYISSFYAKQNGVFKTIWNRIKFCWMFLTGKDFYLYEVVLNKENSQRFIEFCKEIQDGTL